MDLLAALKKMMTGGPVYVQIRKDLVSMRNADSGTQVQEKPIIAIDMKKTATVIAIGQDSEAIAANKSRSYNIFRPFNHPRVIIDDFVLAEKLLMVMLEKLYKTKLLRPAPVIVIHPMEHYEGGLTMIETRALKELGAGIGGREVFVWTGRELTDLELKEGSFKSSEGILDTDNKWQ